MKEGNGDGDGLLVWLWLLLLLLLFEGWDDEDKAMSRKRESMRTRPEARVARSDVGSRSRNVRSR